ncbi:FadR family transcriptional regulator [Actinoplanes sp. LDG1-06]|uniref:FadR family transcriptional regulator n=1 Tax=Paractinoplanes ovalisporus TaxID=2810368 RepID=A0ABS2ASJ8_9ACTN|nr:FadR/GntR family transcriptional regulator [Actinoplanes ovalisporus]MBM2622828.1 FadR family transcriptional regulator [Actinoplanes ovalisporus]
MARIRPVQRKPAYQQVSDRLREFIDDNDLRPGDRLMTERELAAELGVGRSTIREAITALRAQGIVDVRHGEGIYLLNRSEELIPSLATELVATHVDHPYIWEARQAVEVQCARLAARRATADDLAQIDAGLTLMAAEIAAGEPGLAGDRHFHLGVVNASHNPILIQLVAGIREAYDKTSETSLTRADQPPRSLAEHREIREAIAARDPDRAAERMLAHLVGTTDDLLGIDDAG